MISKIAGLHACKEFRAPCARWLGPAPGRWLAVALAGAAALALSGGSLDAFEASRTMELAQMEGEGCARLLSNYVDLIDRHLSLARIDALIFNRDLQANKPTCKVAPGQLRGIVEKS